MDALDGLAKAAAHPVAGVAELLFLSLRPLHTLLYKTHGVIALSKLGAS